MVEATSSLRARLLVAVSVVLAGFLGLTGLSLDRAFRDSSRAAVDERLLTQVYGLLAAAELDEDGGLRIPDVLPDPRFASVASGLYAEVRHGSNVSWRSSSALGVKLDVLSPDEPGTARYSELNVQGAGQLLAVSFAVLWERELGDPLLYEIRIAESRDAFEAQLSSFRRTLWAWLAGAAAVLLCTQLAVVHWGLTPLHRFAEEVRAIEHGERERIALPVPRELLPLAESLNGLVAQGSRHLERYRNALGNLAHSLKTPLAVLRGATELADDTPFRQTVAAQIRRMDETVSHQLQRAAASGGSLLAKPVAVAPIALGIRDALAKVYQQRQITWELNVEDNVMFRGDPSDLMEMLGNLGDNAGKWARSRVQIAARHDDGGFLRLVVSDDGPGIDPSTALHVLERGTRGDENVEGQGIGLAVVRELAEEVYGGQVRIERSAMGGGAVVLQLPV